MTLYIDLLLLLNFLCDFLLLLGTNRLSGFPAQPLRLLGASAFGSLYSGLCLMEGFSFLLNPLWYLVSLGILCCIAFGLNLSALRRGAVFAILSLSLGGMATALHQSRFFLLVLDAGLLWLLSRAAFGGQPLGSQYIPITVRSGTGSCSFTALRDTGNRLRDPVTGESVILLSPQASRRLTGLTWEELSHPLETMASQPLSGLRLIPFSAIGTGSGMLLARKFSHVTQAGREGPAIIAFAPEGLGQGTVYQALTGGI